MVDDEFYFKIRAKLKSFTELSKKDFFNAVSNQGLENVYMEWTGLDFYCNCIIENFEHISLVSKINREEITTKSIKDISKRHKIRRINDCHFYNITESLMIGFPVLELEADEKYPYERDISLMHEIAHLFYGAFYRSAPPNFDFGYIENLIEWKARRWRANPVLLNQAIKSFNLTPQVYDLASAEAFKEIDMFKEELLESCVSLGYWMEASEFYYPERR